MFWRGVVVVAVSLAGAGVVVGTAASAGGEQVTVGELAALVDTTNENTSAFSPALFPHWADEDGDGCDTRAEVLVAESRVPATVGPGCQVLAGEWYSVYDGATWSDPDDVEIDHVVALREAWESGAHAWTEQQRRSFANDLGIVETLQAVTDDIDAHKGDADLTEWQPTDDRWGYIARWLVVKYRWNLTMDPAEYKSLYQSCLSTHECADQVVSLPPRADTPSTGAARDRLVAGSVLATGTALASQDGRYTFAMQDDGNAVVYSAAGRVLWMSGSSMSPGSSLVMQSDGNAVVYAPEGAAVWSSGTFDNPGAWIVLQNDGNLVVYRADGTPAWWSGPDRGADPLPAPSGDTVGAGQTLLPGMTVTSADDRYRLVMQSDGNAVVYAPNRRPIWSSGTYRFSGSRFVMQPDGNMVVYAPSGAVVWHSATAGSGGVRVTVQVDGNLVEYRADARPVWWSGSDPALP